MLIASHAGTHDGTIVGTCANPFSKDEVKAGEGPLIGDPVGTGAEIQQYASSTSNYTALEVTKKVNTGLSSVIAQRGKMHVCVQETLGLIKAPERNKVYSLSGPNMAQHGQHHIIGSEY